MGLFDYIKDKADDVLGAIPDVPFMLGGKPVRLDPADIVKQPLRPVIATTNLVRGIGGTVGIVGKNLTYDLFIQQGLGLNGRKGFWQDPLAAVIEFAQQDLARDILGLPLDPENQGTGSGYGLFAPKGVGGGIFGAVPSEIRDFTRPAISQGVESFHWAFNNLVDNPLSMGLTMIAAIQQDVDGKPIFDFRNVDKLFDLNEWKAAYDVAYNQERSAGQAFATAYYGIDPFDEEAYNAIKTNDLFVIISGTADLYKEWKDPIERAVRGGTRVSRGETAIVKINDQGDIVRQYRFGLPYTPVRQAMPDKIWVVEDGVTMPRKIAYDKDITTSAIQRPADMAAPQGMVSKVKNSFNKPNNVTEQDLALRKTITTETARGMSTSRWFESTWETITSGRLDDINFSASYRNNGVATKADRELVAERAAAWRQAAGRKNGTKLPERVQYALATAPSKPAAQRILREYMGDTTVKGEIDSVIKEAGELLDSDYGLKIKKLDDNDRKIIDLQKKITESNTTLKSLRAQKLKLEETRELIPTEITLADLRAERRIVDGDLESVESATKRIIANRRRNNTKQLNRIKKELDTLTAQRQADSIKIAGAKSENAKLELEVAAQGKILKEVHWDYHFDITNQIKSSQQKKVTLDANGDVVLPVSQLKQWGNAERVTAQIIADDILSGALLADGIVKSVGNRKIYQPIGVVHRLALDKIRRTNTETVVSTYNKHGKKYSYGYQNPQVFTPLGAKFLRVITSRVPQGLIHFSDMGGQSSIMFERIIEDASQFRINGKQILSEAEANQIMATWQRYVYEGADYSKFSAYYADKINMLIDRAEKLMRNEGIQIYDDAGNLTPVPEGFLVKQLNGAQADFLNQLDQNHFKVIDMKETKLTVDEGFGPQGRPRGEVVRRNGEVVDDRGAYGSNQQTYLANAAEDGIDIYTYNLSLAQLGECSVCPRFDLLQREIDRSFNKTNYFGTGKRGTQRTKISTVKRKGIPAVVTFGRGLQEIWTSGKLLSPRWTARVLTDEKLRAAAVIGLLPMLATVNKGFNKYVRNMQARGLNLSDDGFVVALRNEINARVKSEKVVELGVFKIKKELDALDAELFPPKWFEGVSPERLLEAERLGVPVRRMELMDDQFSLLDDDVYGGPFNTLDDLVAATEQNLFDVDAYSAGFAGDLISKGNRKLAALQVKSVKENKKFLDAVKSGDPDRIAAAIKSQVEMHVELWRIMTSPDPISPDMAISPWMGAADPKAFKRSFREIVEDPDFSMSLGDLDSILINIYRGAKKLKGTDVNVLQKVDSKATLLDITKQVQQAGVDLTELMEAASTRYIEEAKAAQRKESSVKLAKYDANKIAGVTARALVGGVINPLIGAAWSYRYVRSRTKNLQDYAVKNSARQIANGFQTEAARIIAEAAGDPDVLELASRLSSSGDQLLRDIKYLEDNYNFGMNWADKSKVVSLFDQADMWWEKAGYPRQTVGNRTFGNAWGSDIRFQRLAERQLSSANDLDTAMRGPHAAAKRQVIGNMPETWQTVDVVQPNIGTSAMTKAWTRTLMQMSRTGTKEIQFYDIMYNDALTHAQKVKAIAALIENTPRLRRKFDIKRHEGKGADRRIFEEVARDAINEVDDFLPFEYFPELRAKLRAGEEISWSDVETRLLDPSFRETHGFKVTKTEPKDQVKEIVAQIREKDDRLRNGFGKARDSVSQPQDMGRFRRAIRNQVDKAFDNLGTSAADDISRGPFFEARYRKHLIDNTAPYVKADGTYDLTPKDVIRMEEEARKAAFKDTREVLYELAEHSELAEMVGFMSPFFNAWQEVIGRWAGLALENPAFAYKGVRLFTKEDLELPILGITQEEDQFGNVNVVFRPSNSGLASFLTNPKFTHAISDAANRVLPSTPIGSVGKLADEVGINFDKDGLFTMLTKTTPSAGPFITYPIRTFMFDLKKPEIEGLAGWMFPFGHPDGNMVERAIQEFAPAWAGHAWYKALKPNERMGLGNTQNYGLTMISMVQYLDAKAREAGTPYDYSDPEVMDAVIKKAEEMTTSIGYLKFLASSVIPVATNAGTPYGPQITRLKELQDQAKLIGESNEWAVKVFLAQHGEEFFFLTGNATRNAKGVAPTIESFKLSQKHEDFIRKYPVLAAVVTDSLRSSIIEDASFSPAVHQMYMNEGWREVYTPEEFIKQTEIQRGYVELNAWKDTPLTEGGPSYNALLNARDGLSNSPNTNVHADLKRLYDQEKERLSVKYPLFGEALNEFSTSSYVTDVIEAARALVEDPDLAYKPWINSLVEYLNQRDDMQRRLEMVPNPDIEAGENLLLRLEWEDIRWGEFATRPDFALFFTRYLENDLIPETSWID